MNQEMRCGDPAVLGGYLYGEIDPAERAAVERHLAVCEICTSEIDGLRATRAKLASWAPPDEQLGFRIVSDAVAARVPRSVVEMPVRPRTAPWWQWSAMPAWAQAAAAVMLFALGGVVAALMNMEVRYDAAGLSVRTGWQQPQQVQQGGVAVSAKDLSALEARMRTEFLRARDDADKGAAATAPQPTPVVATNNDIMRQMRQLVADSEARQQKELALRVSQVVRDLDSTHRADLARIERTVSPMEGVTTEELRQQRQMLNYLMRVSQQK